MRVSAFNRTSLESKPLSSWLVVAQFIAPLTLLIRTSLELKHRWRKVRVIAFVTLPFNDVEMPEAIDNNLQDVRLKQDVVLCLSTFHAPAQNVPVWSLPFEL